MELKIKLEPSGKTKQMKIANLLKILFFMSATISFGQMKPPMEWLNYEEVLGLKNHQRSYDFDVSCIQTSGIANVFWPGEKINLTFQLVNNTDTRLKQDARIEIIRHGAEGIPNDIWLAKMVHLGLVQSIIVAIDIPPFGFQNVTISPTIPEIFGAYAFVFDLDSYGRRLGTSIVKTFQPDDEPMQYPKQSLDDLGADFLSRIGVKAIRMGIPYIPTSHRDYRHEMAQLDKKLREYHAHNITVLPMFMEGPALIPLGTPRSFLDEKNTFLKTKQDYVWLPELDDDFKLFVKNLCLKHGWPRGCITGVHLWNEPWEGISISGWQSDMLRYREIYKAMADGVVEARADGVDVLIGGCDSNSNAWDKLFGDGNMDEFLPIFDFLSIHYQGMEAPVLYPEWNNREYHKGRVQIWDTESWVGNTDDRIGVVVATNRAAGYDRSMGIYGGYMISRHHEGYREYKQIRTAQGIKEVELVPNVWSPAAAMGAVQHMIGERDFNRLLFPKGLPWIMVFDGYHQNPDDGTIMVCGDIGEAFGAENVLFRGVRGLSEIYEKDAITQQIETLSHDNPQRRILEEKLQKYQALSGGAIVIPAHPAFRLFDFYGNPISSENGKFSIPLDFTGYFLRTDRSKGSFARLVSALEKGYIQGFEPVDIIAHDFVTRVETGAMMQMTLSNMLNRPLKGILSVSLGDLQVEYPRKISLKPHESKVVSVQVISGDPDPENLYSLHVKLDTDKDGIAVHTENMRVNLISRKQIRIDGKLDDWQDVLPQSIFAGAGTPSVTEAAWYPFKEFDEGTKGAATGYLAYDEQYFYFASKVADDTPHPGTYRFESIDHDAFFYPDTAYKTDPNLSFKKIDQYTKVNDHDKTALLHPSADGRLMHYWQPDKNNIGIGIDMHLPETKRTQVAFYLPSRDVWTVEVEATDLNTGAILAAHQVDRLWDGIYVVFELSGDVRITFKGNWWYNVKLAGVFFDVIRHSSAASTTARLIKEDYDTRGDWKGVYGADGYWVFGSEAKFSERIEVNAVDENAVIPLLWPEGVRRYSYRKDPVLPDNSTGMGFATDNVQIAFNVLPLGEDGMESHPKGTMPKFTGYKCTDYEYALNQVAPEYGGGTEIWRLLMPGMPRKHFYPRQPASPFDGPVKEGKLAISHEGNTRITECAIPWSELPDVKKALEDGKTVKFSFRVNDNGAIGNCLELARERSVSKRNARAFHADWKEHWANEVEFGFEK